jgi:thiol-disulfide isomerase/thioredoxin
MHAVFSLAVFSLAVFSFPALAAVSAPSDSTLLQFSSQRCQHCQAMQPLVAQLAQQGVHVRVIDVDQQLDVARQYKVQGVPTFVALSGGRETGRIEGATSYEKLAALTEGSGRYPGENTRRDQGSEQAGGRGQETAGIAPEQSAKAATVRIKVEDASGYGFGTGTIIDTHDSESLVVTCGHLFRESKGQGKVTADLFTIGAPQTVAGQLIAYDLDRDIALVSLRTGAALRPVLIAPPGYTVRPGNRVFTIGCDKGAEPSLRTTHITAVNKYKGKPNFTAAGQPIDGRSGGGLFSAEGYLIGICNAADPADDEGLYAGLASIHWQLDQIGQSDVYQRAHRAAVVNPAVPAGPGLSSAAPELPPTMPQTELAPIPAAGDDTEIVFIVRSKRNPTTSSEVFVVDQAPPDLIARITRAAQDSGDRRAALARAGRPARVASNPPPGAPPLVRGQSGEY